MIKKKKTPLKKIIENKLGEYSRYATSPLRTLPDYLIIGAAKCGTTSLYNYLIQHPNVLPSYRKEVHFFDFRYNKGANWYKLNFPYASEKTKNNERIISGESSPYYIFHPLAPQRIAEMLPNCKHICLLRNPIDRAISHYNHRYRSGVYEDLPIEEAFEKEQERTGGEIEKLISNPDYDSQDLYHYSYIARGIYVDQLINWYKHVPKENILVLNSEDFYRDTAKYFAMVLEHLGLPAYDKIQFKVFNSGKEEKYYNVTPQLREKLIAYYRPHNQRLYDLLGVKYDWDK